MLSPRRFQNYAVSSLVFDNLVEREFTKGLSFYDIGLAGQIELWLSSTFANVSKPARGGRREMLSLPTLTRLPLPLSPSPPLTPLPLAPTSLWLHTAVLSQALFGSDFDTSGSVFSEDRLVGGIEFKCVAFPSPLHPTHACAPM